MLLSQLNESVGKILVTGTKTQVEVFTKVLSTSHTDDLIKWLENYDGNITTKQLKLNKETGKKELMTVKEYFNPKSEQAKVNVLSALINLDLNTTLSLVIEFIKKELTVGVYNDVYAPQLSQMKINPLKWEPKAA